MKSLPIGVTGSLAPASGNVSLGGRCCRRTSSSHLRGALCNGAALIDPCQLGMRGGSADSGGSARGETWQSARCRNRSKPAVKSQEPAISALDAERVVPPAQIPGARRGGLAERRSKDPVLDQLEYPSPRLLLVSDKIEADDSTGRCKIECLRAVGEALEGRNASQSGPGCNIVTPCKAVTRWIASRDSWGAKGRANSLGRVMTRMNSPSPDYSRHTSYMPP